MLFKVQSPNKKREVLTKNLESGKLQRFPGAFSPLVSLLIEEIGFDGIYVSGAVLSNDLGYPDIGLTTLSEVASRGRQISRVTNLPSIIDMDTGFGESMSVARTVMELTELGLCGGHLEDQVNPKRCGHLDNKTLVPQEDMVQKIRAGVDAKTDSNFVLIARTDSRGVEGLDKAIERARAYQDAGADMIFPEALKSEEEFEAFRKAIDIPLLANMTEFGKSKLLTASQLEDLGYNLVIYPVTSLRLAMKAVEDGLQTIKTEGSQESILPNMQTRNRLYEILKYEEYNQFDQKVFNFKLSKDQ